MNKFINKFINMPLLLQLHTNTWIHLSFISRITIMTTPLIGGQVTGNDTIDLLRPTLNVHESHCGRTSEIIMH